MRSKKGQFIKGHSGNLQGRPKRADENILIDLWESEGQKVFSDAVKDGKQWAIKLLVDKLYSNKRDEYDDKNSDLNYNLPIPILSLIRCEDSLNLLDK